MSCPAIDFDAYTVPNISTSLQGLLSRKPRNDLKGCVLFPAWRHHNFTCAPSLSSQEWIALRPSSGHPQHSKQLSKRDIWQPDHCPSSQDRQEVKIRKRSETHSLPFTDAHCSLSANFREPKILSVLFRISASKAARYALGRNSTLPAFKASHRNTPLPSHRWY